MREADLALQVLDGEALVTIMDSASAEYEVLTDYCGLALMSETYFPQHCKSPPRKNASVGDRVGSPTRTMRCTLGSLSLV